MVICSIKSCYSINLGGIISTHTVHQGYLLLLQMLLGCFTLYITFRVILSQHSQSLYRELTVWFISGGVAVHRPKCPLVHSPIQKSTIATTSMESPSMLEIVCIWQIWDVSSRVSSHCTLPKSIVQVYHWMQTSVGTIPYIEGTVRRVILL